MSKRTTIFSFPGINQREWYQFKGSKKGWAESSPPSNLQSLGYVFDAQECLSVPLWINSCDDVEINQIVAFELESLLGYSVRNEQLEISKITDNPTAGQSLVHVSIIPDTIDDSHIQLTSKLTNFSVTPKIYHTHKDSIHIWQELGRLVVSFSKKDQLIHWHTINTTEIDEMVLADVHCIYEDLVFRNICDPMHTIVLYNKLEEKYSDTVSSSNFFGLPVVRGNFGETGLVLFTEGVAPKTLIEYKEKKRRQKIKILSGSIITMIVLSVLALCFFSLSLRKRSYTELVLKNESLRPAADEIENIQNRWLSLQSSIDPNQYPIELFHQIFSVLPKGTRLTELSINDDKLTVKAETENVAAAIKLKANLENQPSLNQYQWNIPQPQAKRQGASFIAVGILKSIGGEL